MSREVHIVDDIDDTPMTAERAEKVREWYTRNLQRTGYPPPNHKDVLPMENQHRKITGYRELSAEEIELMNRVKALAVEMGELVADLRASHLPLDNRWISIGATDLQTGFMALTRAIARPETF